MFCGNCGADVPVGARFCPRCGTVIIDDDSTVVITPRARAARMDLELPLESPPPPAPPALPAPSPAATAPSRWSLAVIAAACAVVGASAVGVYAFRGRMDTAETRRLEKEMEDRRAAEQRLQAELKNVRKRAEDVEQALIDNEQQASQARRQQERAARAASSAVPPFARVAPEPRPGASSARLSRAELARRKASEQRAQQEELARRRAEEAALANSQAALPPPIYVPPPVAVAVAKPNPERVCRAESNFITRAICETRECVKEENQNTDYCKALRARHWNPQQP